MSGLVCSLFFITGCFSRDVVLSNVKPYSEMMHKKYRLIVDCYICEFDDMKANGVLVIMPGVSYVGVPLPVSRDHVGLRISKDYLRIVGLMDKGSIFEIVNIVQRGYFGVDYVVRFINDPSIAGQLYSALSLIDRTTYGKPGASELLIECAVSIE